MKFAERLFFAVCGFISLFNNSASATDLPNRANPPSLPVSLMNYSGGNDWTRYEISPNWSRELGWSLKGAFGSYITNDLAMGAIVEYGQGKREYLTNAGVRLSDKISFIGTVGMLEEHREFVADAGKETVQQMEYGASLKGAYDFGLFRGFELNGYLADANSKSDNIETGKLHGTQILTNINLSDATRVKIGGGYEWLHWDEGEENNAFSFRADGVQKLTNNLSAVANVKLGASEYVYGGGLAYNLGDRSNSNVIGINYEHIEGKNGIQSDKRVQVSWTMGMGVGPNAPSSGNISKTNNRSNSLSLDQSTAPANTLLADVMKRPEFLPKRVLARANSSTECTYDSATEDVFLVGDVFDSMIILNTREYSSIRMIKVYVTDDSSGPLSPPSELPPPNSITYFDSSYYLPWSSPVFTPEQVVVIVGIFEGVCLKSIKGNLPFFIPPPPP